jgi:hypothetical protein
MALRNPPSWQQNGSHPAENDRLTMQGIVSGSGIIGTSSLAVTAQGSPNMTVNIAAGWLGVVSSTANAGVYLGYNDATVVQTISTADTTNPRIDIIVATVADTYYGGGSNTIAFQTIAGTAAVTPSAPSTPSNSLLIAQIAVAANTTTITAGNITDKRVVASSSLVSGLALPLAGGTLTGNLKTTVGTTAIAPITLQAGTNLTTPAGGAIEYDGTAAYLTPNSAATGGRALVPASFVYRNTSGNSLASSTSLQSLLGVGIALTSNTSYNFEINAYLTNGGTAHNTLFAIGGTAGYQNTIWISNSSQGNIASPVLTYVTSTGPTALFAGTSTAAVTILKISGSFATAGAGTFIPQIQFSVAPGSLNTAFGWVTVTPVQASISASVGAWA